MGQIHISGQTGLFTNRRKNTCLCGLVSKDQAHKVRSEKAGGAVSLGVILLVVVGTMCSLIHALVWVRESYSSK